MGSAQQNKTLLFIKKQNGYIAYNNFDEWVGDEQDSTQKTK